ncbi:DUF4383 domain-containing protein [Amycolatopsis jiangsuensis]|uniref:DUF4383 domain-containing protein n=1 Tax=Amycolatopsis jiangsuensis TaxID=1181879 RepID=A0A840INL0_9PSEU|nr:DUF4383 domain-containing protein [Amycolatopsis jiangsuensis]MBB4684011.1 hypothetical protein [Amycolatopsis jiangsuensis]
MAAITTRRWALPVVAVLGLVYLVLGVAGFIVPETAYAAGHDTSRLIWVFSSSTVLNIVHVLLGVLGLLAARKLSSALGYCWVLFVAFTGLTAYGILATSFGSVPQDPVNLNWADNWLHGITALIALVVALAGTATGTGARGEPRSAS